MFKNENTKEEKTTVLGITFNTEEERREYFREELRKKLPELKQMEGFPIGEDEDILKLSDPPYYTACPNPWLNDFIEEWEEEKKDLEKQGERDTDFEVTEPYAADISEGKGTAIYNAHSYHTKVPHLAVLRYLLYYTQPGDIIYDGFAGTGMTALASSFCSNIDSATKHKMNDELRNKENHSLPKWGKRFCINSDLSPVASFIAYNYNTPIDRINFENNMQRILFEVKDICDWMYKTEHDKVGEFGDIKHIVWSDILICPECNKDMVFWDVALDKIKGKINDNIICPNCNSSTTKNKLLKAWETKFDKSINDTIEVLKRKPVLISYVYKDKNYQKEPTIKDLELIDKIENYDIKEWIPTNAIEEGHNTNQPIRSHGIINIHHFYTKRNLIELSEFYKRLGRRGMFLFTSLLTRSSKQARFLTKNFFHGGGGWVGTNLSGTLFIPSFSIEVRPAFTFENRINKIFRWNDIKNKSSVIATGAAQSTGLRSNSIDYIFTDPPFGANIMYSELNLANESWLKVFTNNEHEAIENKFQNKSTLDYQNIMSVCFKEYYRILKPGKWMTVEFSNTSASVWNGIQTSIQNAGFVIANTAALDKKQGSFKAVTTPTAVKQDLIISCYKSSSEFDIKFEQNENTNMAVWDFVEEHLDHLPIHIVIENSTTAIIERNPKILFDRVIAFYVQRSLPVPIDAGKFQQGLRERFIERDGMFFTNEQVQKYDKKKKENPEFVQMSLFVSSEQDGVMWLKNFLVDKSLTYQDIQPQWMQALAGVRKGDMIPELSTILEENFLKDESGKWYAPDSENEADLEKLRKGRLLRLFEGYKKEIENPRTKIKEVRVEALREGFKQCYQDKEFKTIVTVGDRIPNNLLMEDEVLLQFYDIASSRV